VDQAVRALDAFVRDVRYAWRALARHWGFTALVAITLALTIGASTTVFSVVNTVLLRPLPYADSDRLVWLWSVRAENPLKQRASYPDFQDWRAQTRTLDLVGYGGLETVLTGAGDPERLRAELFVGDLLALLGVAPMLGSTSTDVQREGPVVVLSHALWQQRFGADPDAIGRSVTLDGARYAVAAVMPAGFEFPVRAATRVDLWIPLERFNPALAGQRSARLIEVIGRLRPGVSLGQAQAELNVIAAGLSAQYPDTNRELGVRLVRALNEVTGDVSRGLLLLGAAIGALLLIGCVNVANLLLTRAMGREKEIAVRVALGAGRHDIARQLLIESLLLAGIAAVTGCVLAVLSVGAIGDLLAGTVPRASEIAVDGHVLAIALGLSLATGFLFGLAPAARGWNLAVTRGLQGSTPTATHDPSGSRLLHVLVAGEMALATILLAGAGLFVQSFASLDQPVSGFDAANVLTFELSWPAGTYRDPADAFERLQNRLLEIPGVLGVSAGLQLPDRGTALLDDTAPFAQIEGRSIAPGERPRVAALTVQPGFFRTLGIPLLDGRDFRSDDRADGVRVAIVNRSFARAYLGGDNPLGERVRLDSWTLPGDGAAQIIGVADDVMHRGLAADVQPTLYLPLAQRPVWDAPMVLKTAADPLGFVPAVREAVRAIDPQLPIDSIQTLEQRIGGSIAQDRVRALLLGSFSVLAVFLAAVGSFAVVSYTTAQRIREIGIRMALGARAAGVASAVVRHGMTPMLIGIAIGLAGAAVSFRLIDSLLFEVTATDPAAFAFAVVVLICVAGLACAIPAWRAAQTDPATVLRSE
jgi:putative ABC transport system permease protein